MKLAIIDCGTNTFTLNLFQLNPPNNFECIGKERHYIELAEAGIKTIGTAPFNRGVQAFESFKRFMDQHPQTPVIATGTAALRQASNAQDFVTAAYQASGIQIQIISGNKEADLIYQGVRLAAPIGTQPSLIMDIGGGSVEFVLANQEQVLWAKSYPVGVAVLFNAFQDGNPISLAAQQKLSAYLKNATIDLLEQLAAHPIEYLIGASGSFDVIDTLAGHKTANNKFSVIPAAGFQALQQRLVNSTFEERLAMQQVSPTRAKLIVMSVLLTDFVHEQTGRPIMIASDHAMREGLVCEFLAQGQ